ncbi:hypothetical protein Tco_0044573 [Tanacetum coccineum]
MEITVVTLVEEQMSAWKGNLPKLPIIIKYSAIGTKSIGHGDEGGGESWRSLRCLLSLYMAVFGQSISVLNWRTFANSAITNSSDVESGGPHDTQYCMEDPEQDFVEYTSLRTDEAGVMIEDLDYLVIPDVRSYIVVLMGYSYHLKEFNCSAQVSQRQMPMWNSLKEVLYFFGLFSSVKGYLGGILLHRSSIYNSARLSNKLGNVTPSVFKFGTFHPPRVYGHPMSIWLPKFQNTWGKRYYDVIRTSQDKEDPSWSTSIKTRRQRRHLQHWKRLECHYIMLYLYLLGTFPTLDGSSSVSDDSKTLLQSETKSLPHVRPAVAITTLIIALKIPNKPLLNTHPCVPMKREFEVDFKQQQSEMTNKIDTVLKVITYQIAGALPSDMVKNLKLSASLVFSARSYQNMDPQCSNHVQGSINAITIHSEKQSDSYDEKEKENEEEEKDIPKNIHVNPSTPPDPSVAFITKKSSNSIYSSNRSDWFLNPPTPRNLIITERYPSNLKIPCNIRHVHVEKAYIDPNSPLNIITQMMYNWIMRRKLDPKENSNRGVSNFTGRIKGMHVFIGNFTCIIDFMIVEDISSIIDHRLSQVVLGKPFIEISNMTHDSPEGVVSFTNGTDEIAFKIPHMIEQYNSPSDLEKEHTKSVYLRNEEDKRRGVEYVMSKILGFYKECLELGPEYVTEMDDEGEVT